MLDTAPAYALLRVIHRVLRDYPQAASQLSAHAGKTVLLRIGPLDARYRVAANGELELAGNEAATSDNLTVTIPVSALPELARNSEAAWRALDLQGDGEFAATLSGIARNVEWDIEEDLSRVIGDIAAHRLVEGAKSVGAWQADARQRLTENIAEFLTEEKRLLLPKAELESFARSNESLRDDLARLEARLTRLGKTD